MNEESNFVSTGVGKPTRVKLGGLWKNKTKGGIFFLSGNFAYGTNLEIWPNKKRDGMEGQRDPDYQVFVSERPMVKKEVRENTISDPFADSAVTEIPF